MKTDFSSDSDFEVECVEEHVNDHVKEQVELSSDNESEVLLIYNNSILIYIIYYYKQTTLNNYIYKSAMSIHIGH